MNKLEVNVFVYVYVCVYLKGVRVVNERKCRGVEVKDEDGKRRTVVL